MLSSTIFVIFFCVCAESHLTFGSIEVSASCHFIHLCFHLSFTTTPSQWKKREREIQYRGKNAPLQQRMCRSNTFEAISSFNNNNSSSKDPWTFSQVLITSFSKVAVLKKEARTNSERERDLFSDCSLLPCFIYIWT